MDLTKYLEIVNLLACGILAGGEFMVCAGLRSPVASLEQVPHIKLRQALILRLRVLTPVIFLISFSSALAILLTTSNFATAFMFQLGGSTLLGLFISLALFGTVPINKAVLDWKAVNPPLNWTSLIHRWEALDLVRCFLAVAAFSTFICAVVIES